MLLNRARQGFTLLELMVVLVILTVMTSLVAPNLIGVASNGSVKTEAYALQKALQQTIDQQWASRQVAFLQLDQNQLVLWLKGEETWQPSTVVYTLDDDLDYELSVNKRRLRAAQEAVNLSTPMSLFIDESGEYLPFRWRIVEDGQQATVVGDGLNVLSLE